MSYFFKVSVTVPNRNIFNSARACLFQHEVLSENHNSSMYAFNENETLRNHGISSWFVLYVASRLFLLHFLFVLFNIYQKTWLDFRLFLKGFWKFSFLNIEWINSVDFSPLGCGLLSFLKIMLGRCFDIWQFHKLILDLEQGNQFAVPSEDQNHHICEFSFDRLANNRDTVGVLDSHQV